MKGLRRIRGAVFTLVFGLVLFVSGVAHAIPSLQLDIDGDTYYNTITGTIETQGDTFTLYAYLIPDGRNLLSDTYYLSIAVSPQIDSGADLGSFSVNGATVNVTGDMTYGTAPIEGIVAAQGWDAGDLPKHGVFPTYFTETPFSFAATDQLDPYNTQDRAISGGTIDLAGSGMYYAAFTFDTALLAPGYGLHFDLYNLKLKGNGDVDVNQFAPFSHDAAKVPEPSTIMLLGSGIVLLHFVFAVKRRRGVAGRERRAGGLHAGRSRAH